jgi:hypothetical protein
MSGQNPSWNSEWQQSFEVSVREMLHEKYFAQKRFNDTAPVYNEEALKKLWQIPVSRRLPKDVIIVPKALKRKNEDDSIQPSDPAAKKQKSWEPLF